MEFKGIKRAEEYASGKSSSAVFRENHIKDYLNGYNQALEDSKYTEILEMLNRIHGEIMRTDGVLDVQKWGDAIEQLIKEATEL